MHLLKIKLKTNFKKNVEPVLKIERQNPFAVVKKKCIGGCEAYLFIIYARYSHWMQARMAIRSTVLGRIMAGVHSVKIRTVLLYRYALPPTSVNGRHITTYLSHLTNTPKF